MAELIGTWRSTEAFGNTSLDWSQAVKDGRARLVIAFRMDGSYSFKILSEETVAKDVTAQFRHVVPIEGKYRAEKNRIFIAGDLSGISWTFQPEEDDTMRIRLEGAKRFGRCKGIDVIYFQRDTSTTD